MKTVFNRYSNSSQVIQNLVTRLEKTDQGKELLAWAQSQNIHFSAVEGTPYVANYQRPVQSHSQAQDARLNINDTCDEDAIYIFAVDQLRRAWQDSQVSSGLDYNSLAPQSYMVLSRFLEADARSYTTAICMEHMLQTCDVSVWEKLREIQEYKSISQAAIDINKKQLGRTDFALLQRVSFDQFFFAYKDNVIAENEANFVKRMTGNLSQTIENMVAQQTHAPNWNKSDPIVNFPFQPLQSLSKNFFLKFTQSGFNATGVNYLRDIEGPYDHKGDFYMAPTPEAYNVLVGFEKDWKAAVGGMNLLAQPTDDPGRPVPKSVLRS